MRWSKALRGFWDADLEQDAEDQCEDKWKQQAADKGARDRRFDGIEKEALAVPGVHQGAMSRAGFSRAWPRGAP